MILAFDVSTSKIGIAILDDQKHIVYLDVLKFAAKVTLLRKAQIFQEYCVQHLKGLTASSNYRVLVEEPLIAVHGGYGQALTTAVLQRFNGMICVILHQLFGQELEMINVNHARASVGVRIPRGLDQKMKKGIVINWALKVFAEEPLIEALNQKTRFGNFQIGVDDMADALLIAAYGARV